MFKTYDTIKINKLYIFLKRVIDIFISLTFIIILFWLFLIIAFLIKIDSKGPVLFKQDRIGRNGKTFKILKFRSMVLNAENGGVYESKSDVRVTKVGKVLRRLSIDELPQFFNILKGDMSLIGPRPALTYHPWRLEEYTEFQKMRLIVKPGVTGYAQINGRKNLAWNERIKYDVYYVNNISLLLDIKIFFKTIKNILLMRDNYNKGQTVNNNLTLMYITNKPDIAKIAEKAGVDWIFVDLEIKGKMERQGMLNTVISKHEIVNIRPIKQVLNASKLLVRVNPLNEDSREEIETVIKEGAEIVMLPFFKSCIEVKEFIKYVNKSAKTCLLLETPEAVEELDSILELDGIDYIHIGLNDLHLGYKKIFMFELLSDGTVENIINKIKNKNIKYGIGGIACLGKGELPAEMVITEHYRLNSTMTILSRKFYDANRNLSINEIEKFFLIEIKKIRDFEQELKIKGDNFFAENKNKVKSIVDLIVANKEVD